MGVFQKLKEWFNGSSYGYARGFSGRDPIFSQFGDNIYSSDVVQSIVACIVTEMTKLKPIHILQKGQDRTIC